MSSEPFTPDEKQVLNRVYQQHEDSETKFMPKFESVLENANKQKLKRKRYRYFSIAAVIALMLSAFIWRYWTADRVSTSSPELNYEFYSTWENPSDELLTVNIYENFYDINDTPSNILLNQNNEVNYENSN